MRDSRLFAETAIQDFALGLFQGEFECRLKQTSRKHWSFFPISLTCSIISAYCWIDQGINLEEGMRLIRRALEQRPDDGFIVNSLGWAYYRISNYDEAVKQLERAVELKPDDATIHDHLGDAYWRTGRKADARVQWRQAIDLKPEPDDLRRIEEKLTSGLPG